MSNLNTKVVTATKWSAITEILSRLVAPVSSIILARILAPEAFGVVTTIMMVVSFAEIFADAGFQKYLIQHEFKSDVEYKFSINVAFWSNLAFSLIIWVIISVFSASLASLVGSKGLGYVLVIASISIPLMAFSSIQMALYKRNFDFKTLFKVRIVGILIPLVVTIPCALYFRNFWALIIGNLAKDLVNAILLTYYSSWKPKLSYSFRVFKEMFSFTFWTMMESLSIWLTNYVDIFIVSTFLTQYYVGLYKTATIMVGHITGLITATTTPILFSSLSRLQYDKEGFNKMFLKFQKLVGVLIFPICVLVFCHSDLVTKVLLGDQWMEASGFIGLWALTSSFTIVMSFYASEVYRAKGLPKLSFLTQIVNILVLCPVVYTAIKYGFESLYIARSLVRVTLISVDVIFLFWLIRLSLFRMISNLKLVLLGSASMLVISWSIQRIDSSVGYSILAIVLSSLCYISIILSSKQIRQMLGKLVSKRDVLKN